MTPSEFLVVFMILVAFATVTAMTLAILMV